MADQPQNNEIPNQALTTSIDDLVNYLNAHGETESTVLSHDLKVPEAIIETWASILEKANIVKISYRSGKMFISKFAATPQEAATINKELEEKRATLLNDVEVQTEQLNEMANEIEGFKKLLSSLEATYKSKAGDIKQVTDKVEAYASELEKINLRISKGIESINKLRSNLEVGIIELNSKVKVLDDLTSGSGIADAQKLIEDINSKLSYGMQETESMRKAFEKQIAEERRKFVTLYERFAASKQHLRSSAQRRWSA